MAEDRPFPPTARRSALARAAGLTAASPALVGAVAMLAGVVFLTALGGAIVRELGTAVRAALATAEMPDRAVSLLLGEPTAMHAGGTATPDVSAGTFLPISVAMKVATYALPLLAAVALAALLAHLVQTRAVWLPRRRLPDAPTEDPMRGTHALLAIANPIVVALVTLGWLYAMAPRLAALGYVPAAGALLVVSFVAALAATSLALGVLDALVRFAGYTAGLRMTREQQKADARLAGMDPRWAERRAELARSTPMRDAVAGASVLVLGDGIAAAVAWDPIHRPIPTRTAVGRDARATQLLALARHNALPVHRDPALARTLATDVGPIPETHWARLAEVIAAVRGRRG